MAVDWINRNLYWSDSHTIRMEVATLDGDFRRSLYIERLSKPRGGYTYLYLFIDLFSLKNIAVLSVISGNVTDKNIAGLCVDPLNSFIYWADWGTFPFIARMHMDGTSESPN